MNAINLFGKRFQPKLHQERKHLFANRGQVCLFKIVLLTTTVLYISLNYHAGNIKVDRLMLRYRLSILVAAVLFFLRMMLECLTESLAS